MTDSNYTHIAVLVDRSGSMGKRTGMVPWNQQFVMTANWNSSTVATDMVKALNDLFNEQATVEGKCLVDYHQFDSEYETVFEDRPVGYAKAVIEPRGMTALLDALGKTITSLGNKLKAKPERSRPGKVMVIVVTDGMENYSREYTAGTIKEMISHQRDNYGWDFVFLGANMDAVKTAESYGIAAGSALTFDTAYVGATVDALSNYTTTYRGTGTSAFVDADREKAVAGS